MLKGISFVAVITLVVLGAPHGARAADPTGSLVKNGGFEEVQNGQPVGWVLGAPDGSRGEWEITTAKAKEGKNALRIKSKGEWAAAISASKLKIDRSKTYAVTGYTRVAAGQAIIKFDYFQDDQHLGQTLGDIVQSTDDWREVTNTSETAQYPTATHIVVTCGVIGEGDAQFDGISLTAR